MRLTDPPDPTRRPRDRRTVLLTGASGVVGQPLVRRLRGADLICLVHRSPMSATGVQSVPGDVSAHRLGLPASTWRNLTSRVDAVVHAAAVTEFNGADADLLRTNVDGTRHVLDFAASADVPLYHVSTAYRDAREDGERGRTAVRYAASKRAGEDLVRGSGLRHVIVRPSVVIGDSGTGETASFQGIHHVAEGILRGIVPIIPFEPSWPIDVIPQDVVADAIATLVEREHAGGEYWLTAGAQAPALAEAVEVLLEVAAELDLPADRPRFVPPELFDRLIAPVFLPALPPRTRHSVTKLLDFFAAYLSRDEPLPSSLPELASMGVMPLPDPRESLRASLRYWARSTQQGTGSDLAAEGEVA